MPLEIDLDRVCTHTCACGAQRSAVYWPNATAWRCACGALWYVDPAGRVWGTEAIRYAHTQWGYFGSLFRPEEEMSCR